MIISHSHGDTPRDEVVIPVANLTGIDRPADVRGYIVVADDGTPQLKVGTDQCTACAIALLSQAAQLLLRGIAAGEGITE